MNTKTIIPRTLGLFLLLSVSACQQKEAPVDPANATSLTPPRPADTDLGYGYVRKDGAIYFTGGGITGTGADATRIDTPSPQLLRTVVNSQYGPFKTCEGLDAASFEALSEQYARDKDRVYFKIISPGVFLVIVLPEADPASFEVLATNLVRDKNHVWYSDRIQAGVDPTNVAVIDGGRVFKDLNSVHYQHETIAGADPASFRHLGSGYYSDRNRVYWGTDPLPDADPATFKVLADSFIATDKSSVFRSGERMPRFDVATLKLILHDPMGHQILSDKNGIHLNKMTFPRSTPGTPDVIDNLTVKAGNLVHLVNTYQTTPVTVFKEDARLVAETPGYDPANGETLAMITAEVTPGGLKNIRIGALPGRSGAPSVPGWQLDVFKRPDLVQRMVEAGKLIP